MDINKEIIPVYGNGHGNGHRVSPDYADRLPAGYRFCPTDSELIVYYLNAKIESRKFPECRLHEVNIYNHKPEELAERYRCSENNWYFLTPRDRRYPKGDRPNRSVQGAFGYWKASQKIKKVLRDGSGTEVVGYRTSLAFRERKDKKDKNGEKTPWLMQEYTTIASDNIPCGSTGNPNKLNDWVLCKIYKHETKQESTVASKSNSSDDHELGKSTTTNDDATDEERNKAHKRRRESEISNYHDDADAVVHDQMVAPVTLSSNDNINDHHMFGFNQSSVDNLFPMVRAPLPASMGFAADHTLSPVNVNLQHVHGGQTPGLMKYSTSYDPRFAMQLPSSSVTLQAPNWKSSIHDEPIIPCHRQYQNQNQLFTCNNNGFHQFPNCVSTSYNNMEPPPPAAAQRPLDHYGGGYVTAATLNDSNHPLQTTAQSGECYAQNMYTFNGCINNGGVQSLLDYGGYTAVVAPTPVTMMNSDHNINTPLQQQQQQQPQQQQQQQQEVHQNSYDQDSPTDLVVEQNIGANDLSMVVLPEDDDSWPPLPNDATTTPDVVLEEIDWTLEYIDSCLGL